MCICQHMRWPHKKFEWFFCVELLRICWEHCAFTKMIASNCVFFLLLFCLYDQYRYSIQIFIASNCIQSALYVLKCLIISFVVCFCSIGLKMPVCKRQISVKISNRSHLLGLGIGFNTHFVSCATFCLFVDFSIFQVFQI